MPRDCVTATLTKAIHVSSFACQALKSWPRYSWKFLGNFNLPRQHCFQSLIWTKKFIIMLLIRSSFKGFEVTALVLDLDYTASIVGVLPWFCRFFVDWVRDIIKWHTRNEGVLTIAIQLLLWNSEVLVEENTLLLTFINGGIIDNLMINKTVGNMLNCGHSPDWFIC